MHTRVLLAFLVPVALASVPVALVSACSSSSGGGSGSSSGGTHTPTPNAPPLLQQDCDPIVPTECGMPYPSNVWTVPDTTRKTGLHVYFGDTTLPKYDPKGDHISKTKFEQRDGFSPGGSLMVNMPGATTTGLADAFHVDQSMTPTSPTILIEYDTGNRVPHWAELDSLSSTLSYVSKSGNDAKTFFMRPAVRLKDSTRYVAAIRNVVDQNGAPLPVNPVFQALRDNTPNDDLSVAPRRQLYADILGKLKAAGIDTSSLQLAWDFTTASKEDTTQMMVAMRDDALNKAGTDGPAYTYTQCVPTPSGPSHDPCGVTENPNPYIRRRIVGQMTVPLYLDKPDPGASLNLGADGMPAQNGTAVFQFLVQIPNSLVNSGKAGAIVQNGHGLFGDQSEGKDAYMAETCDREGYVEIAVDLVGMASDDGATYVPNLLAGDIANFYHVVDRMHQGFINELLAMRMMMGKMSQDPATIFNGKPTIDPTTRFYRGDSQGGISGGVYMAISTDVTRGLLGEPGAPYNILLDRSADFNGFFLIIQGIYPNPMDIQLGLGLIQSLWDRAEPGGYLPYISDDPLPNTPKHNVLLHVAIGDQQVSPLGAHFIARTVGAKSLNRPNREIYGIPDADSGFSGNGFVEWDFQLPASQSPVTNTPPASSQPDPHDALRKQADAQDMSDIFFRTGTVVQTCPNGGPCAAPSDWATGNILPPVSSIDGGAYIEGGTTSTGDGGIADGGAGDGGASDGAAE